MSKTNKIRINIIDQSGRFSASPRVPVNMRVSKFIEEMIKKFNLPARDSQGRAIRYYLIDKSTGRQLVSDQTFKEQEVREGATLVVANEIVGGYTLKWALAKGDC